MLPVLVGWNKTLGQQSDAIYTTDITGNWLPDTGINAEYWDNQATGQNNLRRFNGITHNNTSPHNFECDGVDDYLGPASAGYGGTPFTLNLSNDFTLACWVRYNSSSNVPLFGLGDEAFAGIALAIIGSSGLIRLTANSNPGTTFNDKTLSTDVWYYITVTKSGTLYKIYVNGSFIGSTTSSGVAGTENLNVGKLGTAATYAPANTKFGHVHVYTNDINNSNLRQNFLATHKIHSDRVYGTSYTA